jgi:hypothetical protein
MEKSHDIDHPADIDSGHEEEKPQSFFQQQHHEIYCGLVRLQESLTQSTRTVAITERGGEALQLELGHWREMKPDILMAYKLIEEGSKYIKSMSSKYTLMGKVSSSSRSHIDLANELLRGAEQIATGASFLLQNGCGRSCQKSIQEGVRSTISSLGSLIQVFLQKEENGGNDDTFHTEVNRKTGVVWSTCDELMLLPKGNRSAIRREILGWIRDCMETIEEFQLLLEKHPPESGTTDTDMDLNTMHKLSLEDPQPCSAETGNMTHWDEFCTGQDEDLCYTKSERGIVDSCLKLIKCSRGTLKLTLETCEEAGKLLSAGPDNITTISPEDKQILEWIKTCSDVAKVVGEGVTNLGMQLYPSLQLEALSSELRSQKDALLSLQHCIINGANDVLAICSPSNSLLALKDTATKLAYKVEVRYQQANSAMLVPST